MTRRERTKKKLSQVEVEPGRFVKCKPGTEEAVKAISAERLRRGRRKL